MQFFVFENRQVRFEQIDHDSVLFCNFVPEFERFFELITRVQVKNVHRWGDARDHLQNHHAFRAERGGHGEFATETMPSPFEDLFGGSGLQLLTRRFEIGQEFVCWVKRWLGSLRADQPSFFCQLGLPIDGEVRCDGKRPIRNGGEI